MGTACRAGSPEVAAETRCEFPIPTRRVSSCFLGR